MQPGDQGRAGLQRPETPPAGQNHPRWNADIYPSFRLMGVQTAASRGIGIALVRVRMMTKIFKLVFSILVTKWLADAASRAAHDPRVENIEHGVRHWSATMLKKVLMAVLGAVFFATGLVMTLMSAATRLDVGLPMIGYRTGMAFVIFLAGCGLLAGAARYGKSRRGSNFLGQSRRTRPQLIDAHY